MAVTIKAGARSDFMISDAAMPQRMAEFNKEQMAQFANILSDLGSKGDSASTMDKLQSAMQTLKDDERFEQALKALDAELKGGKITDFKSDGIYRNKSTGDILPTEAGELAKMVVEGKLDLKDIPDELMTEELMKQIIALMIEMRLNGGKDEDDEESDDELFNPATAAVNEQAASREAGNQMLLELYRIIEKRNEAEDEDKVTMLDGISEAMETDETLASIATAELRAEENSEDGAFEQIIDGMTEAAAEAQEEAAQVIAAEGAQNGESQTGSESYGEARPELEEVIESFTAKEADAPKEESKGFSETVSRVQNAGEELEMLKNAKLSKTGESDAQSAIAPDQSLVFTGTNGERIEVKATEIVDQAQRLVERAIEETEIREQSEYSLVLNPGALGRITVRMVKAADGAVSVTIAAENARTQRVLEQHSELMQSNLRSNGIDLESWQTVNESKQDMHAQDYNGSSKNPYYRNDAEQGGGDEDGERTFAEIIASM